MIEGPSNARPRLRSLSARPLFSERLFSERLFSERLPARPSSVLRVGLDLLVIALLVITAGNAVVDDADNVVTVVVVAAVMAVLYLAGTTIRARRSSKTAVLLWLAALGIVWLGLLASTPDATWLAFPLFLLELHLLRRRWAIPAIALTTAMAIVGFIAHQDALTLAAVIGPAIGAAVAVIGTLGYQTLARESEQRRELIEELHAARGELVDASHAAGVAAERERLAREIHDTLAQGLSSIQLLLRAAQRELPDRSDTATAGAHVEHARRTAQDNLAEARRFVRALTPPGLDQGSLPAALEFLCATTTAESDVNVEFHLSGDPVELTTPYEVALLRIAQSALANTIQHAEAANATVTLSYMDTGLALDIVDDGAGFDPDAVRAETNDGAHFGLAAIQARASALGGSLSIESASGEGTALAVSFRHPPTLANAAT